VSAPPAPDDLPTPYVLNFLTDQWEWEEDCPAPTREAARDAAREALVKLVQDEKPDLACITVTKDGARIGVWDWVEAQPYWSWL
jgi:hypothetical protein